MKIDWEIIKEVQIDMIEILLMWLIAIEIIIISYNL
jgi:hypothetical protein